MECPSCKGSSHIKNGKTANKKQQFVCKSCGHRFIESYSYNGYDKNLNQNIVALTKEGVGITGTSRLLGISTNTVSKKIKEIAQNIKEPALESGKTYEVDEMRTYVKKKDKLIWVVLAYCREMKKVVRLAVGSRTNKTLKRVTESLVLSKAKRIYTDGLKNYKSLLDKKIHKTTIHQTNHVERVNLNVRTHLKRLNRKTIGFSRSVAMLLAVLKIYFFGQDTVGGGSGFIL